MPSVIAQKTADFLSGYPPFNLLDSNELLAVATAVKISFLDKNEVLFKIDDPLHDSFYVVASGVLHLTVISDAEEALLNKCYAGDLFGLRPFFAKNNYMMTAKVREEAFVYAIPIDVFKPYVAQNAQVLEFMLQSFASNTRNPNDPRNQGQLITDTVYNDAASQEYNFFQSLAYNKSPLKCSPDLSLTEVAQLMTNNGIDSVLVTQQNKPIGIITDTDFRAKIGTGRLPLQAQAQHLMSSPVVAVPENVSVAEAQLLLLKHQVSHLCVTLDGTDKTDVRGIISEHDLIVSQANNPGILIKEIKKSLQVRELKSVREKLIQLVLTSIQKNIPLPHLFNIAGEITSALIARAIELSILDLGSPPVKFAWLSMGSQGRKEQLLNTDQDHFLIFEDVPDAKFRDTKDYFVRLAKKTTFILENIGYAPCPNGHMASNLLWCRSVSDWHKQYQQWLKKPGEKANELATVFFDYEWVYGDASLEDGLTEVLFSYAKNNLLFFDFLGNQALKKPVALNFFKKFNLEEEGPYKGLFDLKNRGLLPLVDAARLFCLSLGIRGVNNTYARFKQLAIHDPKHAEIYTNAAEAFIVMSKCRTLEGLQFDSQGQYIHLDEINKTERERLKNALLMIKDVEELIKDRFQLTKFS